MLSRIGKVISIIQGFFQDFSQGGQMRYGTALRLRRTCLHYFLNCEVHSIERRVYSVTQTRLDILCKYSFLEALVLAII